VSFGGFDCFFLFVVGGVGNEHGSTLLTFILTPLKTNTQSICGFGCTLLNPTQILLNYFCDRTTSEMSGLSPKIISRDSRRSENAQIHTYKHTVPHMKFKLKLLHIKCHVLEFTQDKAPKGTSTDNQSFCGSVRLSRQTHTLHPRREWASSDDLHL
jgi:hypothetical protein